MGTIEATVDGEMRTWYVVEALTNTGRYASGRWDAEGAGNMTLVLEGFDTQALPLDGFATGPTGASTYGSYRGSVITITVPVAGDAGSIRMNLAEGESGGTMTYVQDAGSEASGSYATVEGSIQGDWAASDDGSIRLEGQSAHQDRERNAHGRGHPAEHAAPSLSRDPGPPPPPTPSAPPAPRRSRPSAARP
jgi:hypothetical protein